MEEITISTKKNVVRNLRVNDGIRVRTVRVIDENGNQLGVMSTREALAHAIERGLDLVEVAPKENPPVCRIMDYGKWKYQQQKKMHEVRKKQHAHEMKELRIRPKIDKHDLDVKLHKAREFLEDGHKVQFTMMFRGRERLFVDRGREIFEQIERELSDLGKVGSALRSDGGRMYMIFDPLPESKRLKIKEEDEGEDVGHKKDVEGEERRD